MKRAQVAPAVDRFSRFFGVEDLESGAAALLPPPWTRLDSANAKSCYMKGAELIAVGDAAVVHVEVKSTLPQKLVLHRAQLFLKQFTKAEGQSSGAIEVLLIDIDAA